MRLMWKIGVEGDKYDVHDEHEECSSSGCCPLTEVEAIQHFANALSGVKNELLIGIMVKRIRECENIHA